MEVCLEVVKAMTYHIRVQGRLDEARVAQFTAVSVCYVNQDTLITAVLPDQSAVYGFLNRLRDLGVTLISLQLTDQYNDRSAGKTNRRDAKYAE